MSDIPLHLAVKAWEPDVNPCAESSDVLGRSKHCQRPGWVMEILEVLLKTAQIPYVLIDARNFSFGGFDAQTGNWTGLFEMVYNEEISTAATPYLMSPGLHSYFEFSLPLEQLNMVFLVKHLNADFTHAAFQVYNVFSRQLWLLVFASFALMIILVNLFKKFIKWKFPISSGHPGANSWDYFRLAIDQVYNVQSNFASTKILMVLIGLASVNLLTLYQSALPAFLITPSDAPLFETGNELLKLITDGKYSILLNSPTHWFYHETQMSNDPFFRRMKDAVAKNPIVFESRWFERYKMITQGHFISPTNEKDALYSLDKFCYHGNISMMKWTLGNFGIKPVLPLGFLFKKGNPILEKFNRALLLALPKVDTIKQKYTKSTGSVCAQYPKDGKGYKQLHVLSLAGSYLLLICGFLTASVFLAYEMLKERNWNKDWEYLCRSVRMRCRDIVIYVTPMPRHVVTRL